ncbi:MAG: SDR family NAD(P)-dependent oxidoreductase [Alphaproteobacteria bacterium]|nr:SDR family NAD(P)-dependent oxidoreductase [Alphaproteobacteria bacterium]
MTDPAATAVALVTDVTHFIGASSAEALAASGFAVLVHDLALADAAARSAFAADHPGLAIAEAGDGPSLIAEAIERFGRLDVLVNNDAFPAERAPAEAALPGQMERALEALVTRPFRRTGAAVPHMKRQGGGRILFVTSAAPLRGLANYGPYCAARGGANALARALALELAPHNIQVNAIAPNFIENPDYFRPRPPRRSREEGPHREEHPARPARHPGGGRKSRRLARRSWGGIRHGAGDSARRRLGLSCGRRGARATGGGKKLTPAQGARGPGAAGARAGASQSGGPAGK